MSVITIPTPSGSGIDQLTGDVTAGPGSGSQAATLANTAVTPGTYGDDLNVAQITVDAKGRVTSVADVLISGGAGGITQLTGDVTAGPGTGSEAATLANTAVTPGSYTSADITVDSKGRVTAASSGGGAAFQGAMVRMASDQTGANYTTGTGVAIPFDTDIYDTDAFHDPVTNNTRLTIPAGLGITKVHVCAQVRLQNVSANTRTQIFLSLNGSQSFNGAAGTEDVTANTSKTLGLSQQGIPVADNDYFEVFLLQATDTSIDVEAARTNFSIVVQD